MMTKKTSEQQAKEALNAIETHIQSDDEASGVSENNKGASSKGLLHTIKGILPMILERVKSFNYKGVLEKCRITDDRMAAFKRFMTSNLGIASSIVFVIVLVILVAGVVHHSHKTVAPFGKLKTTKQLVPIKGQPVHQPTMRSPAVSNEAIMQRLKTLGAELKTTNQRLMVVSEQLINQGKKAPTNQAYRVLGQRLDQSTGQWVADIEYNGQVKAYYTGQRFGKWLVQSVTANNVKVTP